MKTFVDENVPLKITRRLHEVEYVMRHVADTCFLAEFMIVR